MVGIWARSWSHGSRGQANHWEMLYIYMWGWVLFWDGWCHCHCPLNLALEKLWLSWKSAPFPASKVKGWTLELQRIPCYCLVMEHLFFPSGRECFKHQQPPNCSSIKYKWMTCLLTKLKIFNIFWMNLRKKVLTCCVEGEGRRIKCVQEKETKQSSQFCCANIIPGLTHRPDFSGQKIHLHTILLGCTVLWWNL